MRDAKANGERPASEMTKREKFAAMAMQGLLASGVSCNVAACAIGHADALLAELAKEKRCD